MIKRLLILFCMLFGFAPLVEASHVAGGSVTYVSTGPNSYRVRFTMLRDCSGITQTATSLSMNWRSNCGNTGSFTVFLLPGSGTEIPTPCTDDPSTCIGGSRYGIQKYEYEGDITLPNLPANCQDIFFTYGALCCRNNSNTLNNGQAQNFFISAYVNNSAGILNSSAYFRTFEVPAFCILEPVTIRFDADEPDGDSVVYSLAPAQTALNANANYAAGFSPTQPFNGSVPVVNPNNGNISFTTATQQIGLVVLNAKDYRNGILVGEVNFDAQVVLGTGRYCSNITPSYQFDSLSRVCSEDINLTVRLNTLVECSSVSTDASEFRLYYPDGRLVPIASAFADSCNQGRTRVIRLTLARPMNINGFYHMVSRRGRDGDTFGNQCQKYMVEFDTAVYYVSGCPDYKTPLQVLNVSVDSLNENVADVLWKDPDTLNYNWFSAFLVWRKDPINGTYPKIRHTDTNPAARYFADYEPGQLPKDGSVAYKVNLGLINGVRNPLSNEISTMHLVSNPVDNEENLTVSMQWSPYIGWANPVYTVQINDLQRDYPGDNWQYPEGSISTTDTAITFEKPKLPGKYHARIITVEPTSGLKSYSNWVPFAVKARDIKVPNVVTPNGDGVNDVLFVENLEYYLNGNLRIFNRWGQTVYEASAYKNDWSPANLEGGTYFYQLTVQTDLESFSEFKGALEVIK